MLKSTPVNQKRAFQIHAFAYIATMILLVALNLHLGAPFWVIWPFIGWSIGVLCHWWFVLGPGADTGR